MMAMSNSPMKSDRQPQQPQSSPQDSQGLFEEYQQFAPGRQGAMERAAFVIGGQSKLNEVRLAKGWGNPIDKGRSVAQSMRVGMSADYNHRATAPVKKGVKVMPMTEHEQIFRMP